MHAAMIDFCDQLFGTQHVWHTSCDMFGARFASSVPVISLRRVSLSLMLQELLWQICAGDLALTRKFAIHVKDLWAMLSTIVL